jgi:hypothetical protein
MKTSALIASITPDLADEHKAATAALRPYQTQKKAWDAQQAKRRATLRPWDEVEADSVEVDPGDDL